MAAVASDAFHATHLSGISGMRPVLAMGAATSLVLTDDDTGAVVFALADSLSITLPKVADVGPGWWITIISEAADDAAIITLVPDTADGFEGEIASAAADSHPTGVVDKDLVLTKIGANKGDRITLVSDGGTHWWILEGIGIWDQEG